MGRFLAASAETKQIGARAVLCLFLLVLQAEAAAPIGTIRRVETAPTLSTSGVRSDSLLRLGRRTISTWDIRQHAQLLALWNRGDPSVVTIDQTSLDHLIVQELLIEELFGIDSSTENVPEIDRRLQEWRENLPPGTGRWQALLASEMRQYIRTKVYFEQYLENRFGASNLGELLADYQQRDPVTDKLRSSLMTNTKRLGYELLDRAALQQIADSWSIEISIEQFLAGAFVF